MTTRSITLVLTLCGVLVACGSDRGVAPPSLPRQTGPKLVLTRVAVEPFTRLLSPGDTCRLTVMAFDQVSRLGEQTDWASQAVFTSSAPAIVQVSGTGRLTAVAPGFATISAALTLDGVTVSDSMLAMVMSPGGTANPPSGVDAVLTAQPGGGWSPNDISVKAGATVAWVIPKGVQTSIISLDPYGANPTPLEFTGGVATHTFSTPGRYYFGTGYSLTWDEEGGRIDVK